MEVSFETKGKRRGGLAIRGCTQLELERMAMLLEEKTYDDAARRLGITIDALKSTMKRINKRYVSASAYKNSIDAFRAKRKKIKSGQTL